PPLRAQFLHGSTFDPGSRNTVSGRMITVSPFSSIRRVHSRADPVAAAKSGEVVVLSQDGAGSLISADRKTIRSFKLPFEIKEATISPSGDILAVLRQEGISIVRTT